MARHIESLEGVEESLFRGVSLLSLDAGNTVIFLDHGRLSTLLERHRIYIAPAVLIRAEGEAKREQERGALLHVDWPSVGAPGARSWGATVATMLFRAGVPRERLGEVLCSLWDEHVRLNLWSLVPTDLAPALLALRRSGAKVVVVSNSEGMLTGLFEELKILSLFDNIIDSGRVGVEKPDPRIFHLALEKEGVGAQDALHLGDNFATDIQGARAAGIRCALIDPFHHYDGLHPDVLRVPSAAAAAFAITEKRSVSSADDVLT